MRRKRSTSATPDARRWVPISSRYASCSTAPVWASVVVCSADLGPAPHGSPNDSVTGLGYESVGEWRCQRVAPIGEVEVVAAGEGQVPTDELEGVLGVGATAGAARRPAEVDLGAGRVDRAG